MAFQAGGFVVHPLPLQVFEDVVETGVAQDPDGADVVEPPKLEHGDGRIGGSLQIDLGPVLGLAIGARHPVHGVIEIEDVGIGEGASGVDPDSLGQVQHRTDAHVTRVLYVVEQEVLDIIVDNPDFSAVGIDRVLFGQKEGVGAAALDSAGSGVFFGVGDDLAALIIGQ